MGRKRFLLHFGEMLLAMLAGMLVLGGVAEFAFFAAGASLSDASGAVRVTVMGFNMTAGMVAWMAYRRHEPARTAEMATAMVAPTLLAAALAASGALEAEGALALQHALMIPAMLAAMLWRCEHYGGGKPPARA